MPDCFDDAVASLDFDLARELISQSDADDQPAMGARLREHRTAATQDAHALSARIQHLARADNFATLLEMDADPKTAKLLALLPPELARGAEIQLDGARKWRDQRVSASRRHLRRAQEAIGYYDTTRAKSELRKIEVGYLSEAEAADFATLREQLEAAELERMELDVRTSDVLAEHEATIRSDRRRSVLLWAAVGAAVVIVVLLFGR